MDPAQSFDLLASGAAQIISPPELKEKLSLGRPLRVKLGVDPTSADLHLGHTLVLRKLRQFQDLGHEAILIIGDYTAMIGDPSGRSATRPQLTHEQVLAHAESYRTQAFRVLDPGRTRTVFNGDWFKRMSFAEVIRLNSRDKRNALSRRFQFAIDTKMIPAKRPGANNRYAQVAFACDFLCPFAFHRFEAAAVQLKQLAHVLFRLRC